MEFLDVCGLRRSIRIFDAKRAVEREKIQRVLEVVRVGTTCPGNLQPWRAIVVDQGKLAPADRKTLLAVDNYQAAHAQAPPGFTGSRTWRRRGRRHFAPAFTS